MMPVTHRFPLFGIGCVRGWLASEDPIRRQIAIDAACHGKKSLLSSTYISTPSVI